MGGGASRGPHLTVAGLLVMAAAAVLLWSALTSGERSYFGFAALLVAASVGLFMQQTWAKYLVFAFAAASLVWWFVGVWYSWRREDQAIHAMIVSLVPGMIWCAFWLSLCLTVHRGFQGKVKPE